jgi:predicted transcriptional regulator
MDQTEPVRAHAELELAHGFNEWRAFNVADCAAHLIESSSSSSSSYSIKKGQGGYTKIKASVGVMFSIEGKEGMEWVGKFKEGFFFHRKWEG